MTISIDHIVTLEGLLSVGVFYLACSGHQPVDVLPIIPAIPWLRPRRCNRNGIEPWKTVVIYKSQVSVYFGIIVHKCPIDNSGMHGKGRVVDAQSRVCGIEAQYGAGGKGHLGLRLLDSVLVFAINAEFLLLSIICECFGSSPDFSENASCLPS